MAVPQLQSLLIRLPNHLGDACMTLPALDRLAAAGVSLVLAGRRWAPELLAARPWPVIGLPDAAAPAGEVPAMGDKMSQRRPAVASG